MKSLVSACTEMCMTAILAFVCVPALAEGRTTPEEFDYSLLDRAEARARELCSKMTLEERPAN